MLIFTSISLNGMHILFYFSILGIVYLSLTRRLRGSSFQLPLTPIYLSMIFASPVFNV